MTRRVLMLVVAVTLVASGLMADAKKSKLIKHRERVRDSYVVRLTPVTPAEIDGIVHSLVREYGLKLVKHAGREAIFRRALQGFGVIMTEEKANTLAQDPRVAVVEENAIVKASATQYFTESDPHFNLDRLGQSSAVSANNRSYTYTSTGSGVYVYVLDGGVQRNHIEFDDDNDENTAQLNPRVVDGPTFANDPHPATNPCGGFTYGGYPIGTHGTAVASVIAGKTWS